MAPVGDVPRMDWEIVSVGARHESGTRMVRTIGNRLGHCTDVCRQFVKTELLQLNFGAGIVNINAYQIALGIVVENNPFRDLLALYA